jgi:hypothetical protein
MPEQHEKKLAGSGRQRSHRGVLRNCPPTFTTEVCQAEAAKVFLSSSANVSSSCSGE